MNLEMLVSLDLVHGKLENAKKTKKYFPMTK